MTERPQAKSRRWLTIIGMGDNGAESLSAEARRLLGRADTIVASSRLLEGMNIVGKSIINWDKGLQAGIDEIRGRAGQQVTVLATGDPMHFGIGATLRTYFDAEEMLILPSPSAFSLAAARLGWPLQNAECISLHGRPLEQLQRYLSPRARIIALTSDGASVPAIASLLKNSGYGDSLLHVLEHMGGPKEQLHRISAEQAATGERQFDDFNTLAIDCAATGPRNFTLAGLDDDLFRHDGQLTKSEIRAVTIAKLRPFAGGLLWDVGAGCGSIAIEWMRAARNAKALAIEAKPARIEMIKFNAKALGVPGLSVVAGSAPDALAGLETPDAVFIGGGLSEAGLVQACWQALGEGGILVANAVTLEGEAALTGLRAKYGGELVRISVARAAPVGRFCGWKSLMPVTIWSTVKGNDGAHGMEAERDR